MSVHLVPGENQKKTLAGIGPDRVSNFGNLIRVTAYVQKFSRDFENNLLRTLSTHELQGAEMQWQGICNAVSTVKRFGNNITGSSQTWLTS